jgi:hypothetical protein
MYLYTIIPVAPLVQDKERTLNYSYVYLLFASCYVLHIVLLYISKHNKF